MNKESKLCQNCKGEFIIEPEDFSFYDKIKVPAPTFCPKCRFQRRLAFFNLINLYKRPCGLCKKDFISMYPPESLYKIYCAPCWWSDNWGSDEYGRDYDFSRPFFEQLNDLWRETPLLGLSLGVSCLATSPHNNHAGYLKNCYLLFWANHDEECAYGFNVFHNKDVLDCTNLMLCELSYDLTHAYKSVRSIGSYDLTESINCAFLKDSHNCQDCFASANLRNKKYYIFNKPYGKEDYFNEIKKWDLGSYKIYQEVKKLAEEHWKKFPPDPVYGSFNTNSTGNRIYESKNCKECFEIANAENCKYITMMYESPIKDCYDVSGWGDNISLSYECGVVGEKVSNLRFCQESGMNLYNAEYSKLSTGGKYHFGCVSMKKGDYCILNKRYSEDEFFKLREKIIAHMDEMPYTDKRGNVYKYGEFFPPKMSPSAYNETIANKFFPMTKEEVGTGNYRWHEPESHSYSITKQADELPDHIKDVTDEILKEVIACPDCGRGFRIARMELDFLRKMNLPLPRVCPFCRVGKKLDDWVKEFKLIKRTCDNCGIEFETPHTEQDYPRILCKKCWLQEVI